MNSHERFAAACTHRTPDRPPIDYMATRTADIAIRGHLGVRSERELLDALGCDLYHLTARDLSQNEAALPIYRGPPLDIGESERTCPFGIRYRRAAFDWKFGADEVAHSPLQEARSPQEVLRHPWPKAQWFDLDPLLAEAEEHSDRVVVSGFWTAIFGNAYRLYGFSNFLMNMSLNPELIKALVGRLTDFYLELNERLFSAFRGRAQVYYFGNDFGTQQGLLFSREMWREFFGEPYRLLAELARRHGLKVMTHSCGAVGELIEDFLEAGIDILDPVQTTAAGMEAADLKRRFGKRLVFHGGVDTQGVLPGAGEQEVRRHVRALIDTLGQNGGYIFAPCNAIQSDTPPENVLAMYSEARKVASKDGNSAVSST
jgi:uroporphyrinogen decarboxylase